MDAYTKNIIHENVEMKSLLKWFFEYAEIDTVFDEELVEYREPKGDEEKQYVFPNVVILLSEKEYNEMLKIINRH